MNRFRNKKKVKDDASSHRPSIDSESSSPFRMFSKKKVQDEEKEADLDLSNVLPPSDDFRTSLLMTGLSARFSMLREQDDPTTKVGKASDDSVLFPKGHSKMTDFGLAGGLQDISEVESIRPYAFTRADSFQSEDSGSVMGRSKPIEGNNLFGGRQKIYRIPANSSGPSKNGGMPGRALYDDDVALSAFQKWRLAEKERQEEEEQAAAAAAVDPEPPQDTSRRRETSSTTSSAPSVAARFSTAATSVASRPASSIKDSQVQSSSAMPTSSSSTPVVERTVTRTRRLYEQGLSRDLHDQQSSTLSRMDTVSKSRQFGSFTPDLTSNGGFADRVDRRPIMGKASAPNLRSFTPPVTSIAQMSTSENNSKAPQSSDSRVGLGTSLPLSPPVSEAGDVPMLPIQSNVREKATSIFDRPAQKYDDSRYGQRQRQLQQDRDTSTNRSSVESRSSAADARSRSSSSIQRKQLPGAIPVMSVPEEKQAPTFFDDSEETSVLNQVIGSARPPQLSLERPDDDNHPAFRKSALPTPLSLASKSSGSLSPLLEQRDPSNPSFEFAEDSPTLGPNSGLSGMVRAHLRSDSTASSIYGTPSQDAEPNAQNGGKAFYGREASPAPPSSRRQGASRSPSRLASSTEEPAKEKDEFARHLADGARRVRERLTTYTDTDADRSVAMTQPAEVNRDVNSSRSNALGILGTKSSRGSLFDQNSRDQSQPRSTKTGMSSVTGLSPSPRQSLADSMDDGRRGRSTQARDHQPVDDGAEQDDNVHVGLKAFRQARRELQKMKEIETAQRYQASPTAGQERPPMNSRAVSHDGPPPAMFNRMPRSESRNGSDSRATSRVGSRAGSRAPSERDRSGSETSNSGQPQMRSMRMRNGSVAYDEHHASGSPSASARHSAGLRSAGPPGVRQRPYESGQPSAMSRPRDGSLLGATASTPNLHAAPTTAPPLPPINPRRKNGVARPGEDDSPLPSPRMPGGFPGADDSDDDCTMEQRRQRLRRVTSEGNSMHGRARTGSRPPLPGNMAGGRMPGGMI